MENDANRSTEMNPIRPRYPKSRSTLLATLTGADDHSNAPQSGSTQTDPNHKSNSKESSKTKNPTALIPVAVAKRSNNDHQAVPTESSHDASTPNLNGTHVNAQLETPASNKYLAKSDDGRKRKRAVDLAGSSSQPRKRPRRPPSQSTDKKSSKPPKSKLTFIEKATPHGSYKEYKRRRVIDANDPRLKLLRTEWLPSDRAGRVLDIGCNDGALTLHVARRYPNAHVLGIDIDQQLIERAKQRRNDVATAAAAASKKQDAPAAEANALCFPDTLSFMVEDVCESHENSESALKLGHYDLILMMSVSKWLHMKGGDDGLKRIFGRVKDSLAPGGVLILEPQLSKSYKAARRKGAVASNLTLNKFKLKPEKFADYLVGEGGFERVEQLRNKLPKNTPFGNRPVMAFYKQNEDKKGLKQ